MEGKVEHELEVMPRFLSKQVVGGAAYTEIERIVRKQVCFEMFFGGGIKIN